MAYLSPSREGRPSRDSMPNLEKDETYTVRVTDVADGDTATVEFDDGSTEEVRLLGIDTSEIAQQYERPEEWVGVSDPEYLVEWANKAKEFAWRMLMGEEAILSFDPNAAVRDEFGRVLGYLTVDGTLYNRAALAQGYARVYNSGFSRHNDFAEVARTARANGRGLWANSDPENTPEIRNSGFSRLFFPLATAVGTDTGRPDDKRVPVFASPSAQRVNAANTPNIPLVAVDGNRNVVMLGSPIVHEDFEKAEEYAANTAQFGNFPFLTNLLTRYGNVDGDVLIEGGHGQFSASYALSAEDAAYYGRYLEGVGLSFDQYNGLTSDRLDGYRAVIITTPTEPFTSGEVAALKSFTDRGGAVVLMGASTAPESARSNLNDLAASLGTDLRVSAGHVQDPENSLPPLKDDEGNATTPKDNTITTSIFNGSFDLFRPYRGDTN